LRALLSRVFAERSEFAFDSGRFEAAYDELERALYEGRCVTTVIAPLLGVALDETTSELALDDGLSLVAAGGMTDAPADAVWGPDGLGGEEPGVLAVLRLSQARAEPPPMAIARVRFRRILTALRLFERGGYALSSVGWTRTDGGPWRPVPLGGSGRPGPATFIPLEQEDELRAFFNLIARCAPWGLPRAARAAPESSGSRGLAWALARFEMGCERLAPFEALTDYLLALRALLEPEGPASGRLAGRLAALCAKPEDRAALAERTAHAISLEHAVIAGLAPAQPGADGLVDELGEHLRALLRDVLCGHLDADLVRVADEFLVQDVPAAARYA
jgi:hypothetical protein